jgi:hypothetical protein
VLIFATSDKGGTGRSVTSINIAYRRALMGSDVCYLDFDFGSPTAGAIFDIEGVAQGTKAGGLHSYFYGETAEPLRLDVWKETDRPSLRDRPPAAGRLVLMPGDNGGGEFPCDAGKVRACTQLLLQLESDFDMIFIDLSAGRSYATDIALAATAAANVKKIAARWLIFHRWTRQHVRAAAALVNGRGGILDRAVEFGHERAEMEGSLRFVRTAVINPNAKDLAGLRASQIAYLHECDKELVEQSVRLRIGRTRLLGSVPLEPLLQWREQLISDNDLYDSKIANRETVAAFEDLAEALVDDANWGVV